VDTDTKSHSLVIGIMHSPVLTIERTENLRAAARALRDADVGTLAVMDGPEIAGILSERDLVRALGDGADPDRVQVAEFMSAQPRYLTTADEVGTAVEMMLAAGIRHLPVYEEGDVVGIVSMRDLVGAMRPRRS
jgi:CBS domain-containing protein